MKISSVKPFVVKVATEDSFGGHGSGDRRSGYFVQPGWRGLYSDQTETTLVRIETDDGIVGWGEGQSPVGPEVTASIITHVLGPMLLGKNPADVQVLQRDMYQGMNLRGHYTGFMMHAVSAVDIALWDIKGKALGQPVASLLGGVYRTSLPAYVSGIRGKTLAEKICTIRQFKDSGFYNLKTFLGFGIKPDLEHVEAFVSVLGSEGRLMVDVLWNYDVSTAIQLGRSLEKFGVAWFESPTAPEDVAGHAEIARALDIAVAGGETETTRYQFLRWFQERALDIAQPDVARCGITEIRRIADLADTFHLPVTMHTGIMLGPGLAASLQVASSLPNLMYQEFQPLMLDIANQFLRAPIRCERGSFELPSGTGLGVEMDEEKLAPHIVRGS